MKSKDQSENLPEIWASLLTDLDIELQRRQRIICCDEIGQPSDDAELQSMDLDSLLVLLCRCQRHLSARARHNQDAAAALYNFASRTTKHLWALFELQPNVVKEIAKKKSHFPAYLEPVPQVMKRLV